MSEPKIDNEDKGKDKRAGKDAPAQQPQQVDYYSMWLQTHEIKKPHDCYVGALANGDKVLILVNVMGNPELPVGLHLSKELLEKINKTEAGKKA